jgi:hypothetical protein
LRGVSQYETRVSAQGNPPKGALQHEDITRSAGQKHGKQCLPRKDSMWD